MKLLLALLIAIATPASAMERTILHAEGAWGVYVNFDGAEGRGTAYAIGRGNRDLAALTFGCSIGSGPPAVFYVQVLSDRGDANRIVIQNQRVGQRREYSATSLDTDTPNLRHVFSVGADPTEIYVMLSHDIIVSAAGRSFVVPAAGAVKSLALMNIFCRARDPAATVACLVRQPLHALSGQQCPQ